MSNGASAQGDRWLAGIRWAQGLFVRCISKLKALKNNRIGEQEEISLALIIEPEY